MNTSLVCWTLLTCMTCVLTACGTEEDKALPGDSDIVEGADDAAGEPDGLDCSMDDGTCPEPCRAGWATLYDPVLDCMALERQNGDSGSMLFQCGPPDVSSTAEVVCVCNSSGRCGQTGAPLGIASYLPGVVPCDDGVSSAASAASTAQSICPPGHFE
jgi:hypothetical protein